MDITTFLEGFLPWVKAKPDVVAVALVGSYARGAANEESDVDLIILTSDFSKYLRSQEWLSSFGEVEQSTVENWGRVETIRATYKNGLEIEYNFSAPGWAAIPIDPGTRRVVNNGLKILHDPKRILSSLQKAVLG